MKTEFLESLNLDKDVIQKIQAESGKDVTDAKQKLQSQIDTLQGQVTDLSGQVEKRDSDLKELQQKLTDAGQSSAKLTQIQQDLTTLQSKYETDKNEWQTKLVKQNYEFLAKDSINNIKFSSNAAKKEFLNGLMEKNLPVQDNKLLGFEDYLKTQQESDPGAFVIETPPTNPPKFVNPASPTPPPSNTDKNVFGFNFVGVRAHDDKK